ncbi:MAG: PepSY domain-containing protein, partial [Vicinamibacterales bacterium]
MIKRVAIVAHRWLGVAFCLLFFTWFLSGIGMMYWDYPAVTAADRLARSPALDPSRIVVAPEAAYARLGESEPVTSVRLNTFDGRPVYRFRIGRRNALVYADTGEPESDASPEMMLRVAAAWTGRPASASIATAINEADQWTLEGPLRTMRPLWKFSWPSGEQVYISQASGEVVQFTTTASRVQAYLGPIPHWVYFTPLRRHGPQWSTFVIWSSGLATLSALLGLVVGIWIYSPSQRYRRRGAPTSIPYSGQKRWHLILGLIFGVASATWAFSGMLSMDPFPLRASRQDTGVPVDALLGRILREPIRLDAFSPERQRQALAQLTSRSVKELEFASIAGDMVFVAVMNGGDTRLVPLDGSTRTQLDRQHLAD